MVFFILLIVGLCLGVSYWIATLISKSQFDRILCSLIILLIVWFIISQLYLYFYESVFEGNSSLLKAMYLILPIPYITGLLALIILLIKKVYQHFHSL